MARSQRGSAATTVLIPTADRADTLRRTIEQLQRAPGCPRTILVSEAVTPARSTTQELCSALSRGVISVALLPTPPCPNPSGNRNWLARHAEDDLILFVDDDIDVDPRFVYDAHERLQRGEADIVVAATQGAGSGWLTLRGHYRNRRGSEPIAVAFACAFWRRDVFFAAGMLDERIIYGYEDADISLRLPDGAVVTQSPYGFVDRGASLVGDAQRLRRGMHADAARAFVALRRYQRRRQVVGFIVIEILANALRRRRHWLPPSLYKGQWRQALRYLLGGSRPTLWSVTRVAEPNE